MEAMEAILSRRSIRKYKNEKISDAVIQELLAAAMAAPSANNQQPWQFVVITEKYLLEDIPRFHPYSKMLREAAFAILICGEEKKSDYWVQDCSAASQNLLLAAHAKGLGGVWLGIYPREDRVQGMRALLSVPEGMVPFALASIGVPAEKKSAANRYDASRVHHNKW